VKNPLVGSFVISFCVVNYKFFLIVASGVKLDEKLDKLNGLELSWGWPVFMALAYSLFAPLLAIVFSAYYIWQQKVLRWFRHKIEEETPLTPKESDEIRNQARNDVQEVKAINASLNSEIKSLKDDLKNKEEIIERLRADKKIISSLTRKSYKAGERKIREAEDLFSFARSEYLDTYSYNGFFMDKLTDLFNHIANSVYKTNFKWNEYNRRQWESFVNLSIGPEKGMVVFSLEDDGVEPEANGCGLTVGTPVGIHPYTICFGTEQLTNKIDEAVNEFLKTFYN
jgi:hypothetical protein